MHYQLFERSMKI